MIINLAAFIKTEQPFWRELEGALDRIENESQELDLEGARRLHYLYQRVATGLARLDTGAHEPATRRYLEALLARAYGEIHSTRDRRHRFTPLRFLLGEFPRAFRRHLGAFALTLLVTLIGAGFGAFVVSYDSEAKAALLPFGHGDRTPEERVKAEEETRGDRLDGVKGRFSAQLMVHNTKVSILTLALGISWGIGPVVILFWNGVILGGIIADYINWGQGRFLAGWLLPHGVIEIPAILLAGQAAFILSAAMIGWGDRTPLRLRLRRSAPDIFALISGAAMLLVWAGLVEAFFSQYHEPLIPYGVKISFGLAEFILFCLFLALAGRGGRDGSWQRVEQE